MTVETKLPVEQEYLDSFSKGLGEPEWFSGLRANALTKAGELELPKPDKTKITKWNFTEFKQHTVDSKPYENLSELPEAAKALIEIDNENNNLYIQRNNTPAYLNVSQELKDQGVIFTDIHTAVKEHGDLFRSIS